MSMTPTTIPEAEVRAAIKAQPLTSREPAVITGVVLGAVASIATAIAQARTPNGIDWLSAAPMLAIIATSVAIRFGVVSPARAQAVQDELAKVAAQAAVAAPAVLQFAPDAPVDQIVRVAQQLGAAPISNPDITPG